MARNRGAQPLDVDSLSILLRLKLVLEVVGLEKLPLAQSIALQFKGIDALLRQILRVRVSKVLHILLSLFLTEILASQQRVNAVFA